MKNWEIFGHFYDRDSTYTLSNAHDSFDLWCVVVVSVYILTYIVLGMCQALFYVT